MSLLAFKILIETTKEKDNRKIILPHTTDAYLRAYRVDAYGQVPVEGCAEWRFLRIGTAFFAVNTLFYHLPTYIWNLEGDILAMYKSRIGGYGTMRLQISRA